MNISRFKIFTTDRKRIINYLNDYLSFEYENHSSDMSILADEEFYFRNSSTQMNMVILKTDESSVVIDIIGGAGGSGLLNINLWSEKGYIKKVSMILVQFSEEFNIKMEEI